SRRRHTWFSCDWSSDVCSSDLNGKWYGFVCSMNDNAIFRLDFGASLSNKSPDLVRLNSTGGLLNFPQDIKVMEYEGEFFAFIYKIGRASYRKRVEVKSDNVY